jgi:hypothetical protein
VVCARREGAQAGSADRATGVRHSTQDHTGIGSVNTRLSLGPGFYDTRISNSRKMRNHISQLEALGYKVTLEPAARQPGSEPGKTDNRARGR